MLKRIWKEHMSVCCSVIVCVLVGLCAGAFAVNNLSAAQTAALSDYMNGFSELYTNERVSAVNLLVLASGENFKNFGFLFLAGLSIIGLPAIYLLCATRAFLCGFSVGVFLRAFGTKGILISLLTLVPGDMLKLSAYLLFGIYAVIFSIQMLKLLSKKDLSVNFKQSIAVFLKAAILAVLLLSAGVLYEVFVSPVVLRFLL